MLDISGDQNDEHDFIEKLHVRSIMRRLNLIIFWMFFKDSFYLTVTDLGEGSNNQQNRSRKNT
ncbi:hypothetical protein KKHLCK_12975 [Candidatus Electrothrix laxa]